MLQTHSATSTRHLSVARSTTKAAGHAAVPGASSTSHAAYITRIFASAIEQVARHMSLQIADRSSRSRDGTQLDAHQGSFRPSQYCMQISRMVKVAARSR
ncbi:unnamed protein product [Cercospora beticola]|nr:unnamed protein product [Cercospora beticola]